MILIRRLFCLILALALLPAGALRAAVDESPRKRGGFSGTTPKPVAKKSTPAERTPAPKKSPVPESSTRKKATPSEATPSPKKKPKPPSEDAPTEKPAVPADEPPKPVTATGTLPASTPEPKKERAPAATIEPTELSEFANLPPRVQALITAALELTKLNLTYTYGSADPAQGGMDCSGTMYYLLRSQGFKDVPRDSSSQYVWARKAGPFFAVVSKTADGFEFKDLQPGDLLFWTGTYQTNRDIPISHVMLYLGIEKKTKKRVMFGSSDGRSYAGIQRWGVSVFDFKMPNGAAAGAEGPKVDFVGYGRIPGLREAAPVEIVEETPATTPAEGAAPAASPRRTPTGSSGSSSKSRKKKTTTD
jgi:cell wall-associated NlpC family hydrolase